MQIRTKLRAQLTKYEGEKLYPYTDTLGNTTIGVGRNLTGRGITAKESSMMLDDDIDYFLAELPKELPWFNGLDENRQIALCNMAFNLGMKGFLEFKNMLLALEKKYYAMAAHAAMQSMWAHQVGQRAADIAHTLETGEL